MYVHAFLVFILHIHTYTHTHTHTHTHTGNHFCEYAGFDPDYEKSYPGKEAQFHFFRAYLKGLREREEATHTHTHTHTKVENGDGEAITDTVVTDTTHTHTHTQIQKDEENETFLEDMYTYTNRYACAAHLFWGYWAIIQAKYSPIDFDFLLYAQQRLDGYEAFKRKYF